MDGIRNKGRSITIIMPMGTAVGAIFGLILGDIFFNDSGTGAIIGMGIGMTLGVLVGLFMEHRKPFKHVGK